MNWDQQGSAALDSTRRAFLGRSAAAVGQIALWQMLGGRSLASAAGIRDTAPLGAHHRPRIRRVLHLYMAGGPSHLETLDEKPRLAEMDGEPMPASMMAGQQVAQLQGKELRCFAPQFRFQHFGQSGLRLCERFPHMGRMADRLCVIRSMHTDQINHDPAHTLFNTGTTLPGRPSMGSWIWYGLGCESQDLPGFVVLTSVGKGGQAQPIAARQWHSGHLPSRFQGVELRSQGDAVHHVRSPEGVDARRQRDVVDAVQAFDRELAEQEFDAEARARIAQYELAFRMQTSVPELVDFANEPRSVLERYGTAGADGSFAGNCLLARRLLERGVRFVQVYHRAWDHHGGIRRAIEITADEVDRATAAVLEDLDQRGMLDDTLVLWGGEFGRTPMAQGNGRDHHIRGFSYLMAGGPIRGGTSYGATDELGCTAVENPVHVRDLHATMLHLLGIDHERLAIDVRGLKVRLTGVEPARVLHEVIS